MRLSIKIAGGSKKSILIVYFNLKGRGGTRKYDSNMLLAIEKSGGRKFMTYKGGGDLKRNQI